jgi:predicted GH43/DUF377 family glycosyl hydrolase
MSGDQRIREAFRELNEAVQPAATSARLRGILGLRDQRAWVPAFVAVLLIPVVVVAWALLREPTNPAPVADVPPVTVAGTVPPTSGLAPQQTVPAASEPIAPMTQLAGLFEPMSEGEIVPLGAKGEWDSVRSGAGAVVFHDGSLHMFRNATDDNINRKNAVDYWRSDDGGESWIDVSDGPIFDGSDIDYVQFGVLYVTSVLVEDDGTWVLYFYTHDGSTWELAPGRIGRATAPGPVGPWVADEDLVLLDDDDSWDSYAVRSPSVLKVDGEYVMYYDGVRKAGESGRASIGRATSVDGIEWVKDPDPLLIDQHDGWASKNVFQPNVVKVDGGWVMLFSTAQSLPGPNSDFPTTATWSYGFASSANGLDWIQDETRLQMYRGSGNRFNETIEFAWAEGTFFVFAEESPHLESPPFGWSYDGTLIGK